MALSKIMTELETSVGMKDKTLAEFILSMARKSQNVDSFEKLLAQNGADFEQDLVNAIYAVVTRIFPKKGGGSLPSLARGFGGSSVEETKDGRSSK